jgi:hypothetical protein
MDYHAFTNDTLAMMYFGALGALVADDEIVEIFWTKKRDGRTTRSNLLKGIRQLDLPSGRSGTHQFAAH